MRAALLDSEGRVIAANRSWLRPAGCDAPDASPRAPLGSRYLAEFLARAAGGDEDATARERSRSESTSLRAARNDAGQTTSSPSLGAAVGSGPHADDRLTVFAAGVLEVLEGRRSRFEAELSRDGPMGRFWYAIHVGALEGEDRLTLVTETDVTAQRRGQEALAASEGRLRMIVTGAPIVLFSIDLDGVLSLFDGLGATSLGVTPDRVAGRSVFEVFAHVPQLLAAVRRAMSGETTVTTAPIGSMTYELRCSPALTSDQQMAGVVGIATDITERARIERLKNEFVSIVSHELRTPLTSIRGSLGLLDGGIAGPLQGRAQDLVKIALANTERLIRLVNDILDLDKIETGRLDLRNEVIDPAELVDEAMAEIAGYADSCGVNLVRKLAPASEIRGDRDRLLQVLINLLSNAIKFSKAGDTVTLEVEQIRPTQVRFSVCDEGPGIAEDQLPKLFRKFSQLDDSDTRSTGGSGLGLAISKAIVDAHGGVIGVSSRTGVGSRFHFTIPSEIEDLPQSRPRTDSTPLMRIRRLRSDHHRIARDDEVIGMIDRARPLGEAAELDPALLRDLQLRARELARRRGTPVALRSGLIRVASALTGLANASDPTTEIEHRRALAEALTALEGEAGFEAGEA